MNITGLKEHRKRATYMMGRTKEQHIKDSIYVGISNLNRKIKTLQKGRKKATK